MLRGAERTLERFNPWVVVELNHALAKRDQSVNEALEWLVGRGYESAFITDYENFILRREDGSGAPCAASMQLSFDARPLFIRAAHQKGEALLGLVAPDWKALNEATIEFQQESGIWRLTAPGPRWSFAASWTIASEGQWQGAAIIEIDLRVSGGTIGVVCQSRDYSTQRSKEALIDPSPALQKAAVLIEDLSEPCYLVIRNNDSAGGAAQIEIVAINAFAAEPAAPEDERPLLSPQKTRLSIAECDGILRGGAEPSSGIAPESGIAIVPVEQIQSAFGFRRAFMPKIKVYRRELAEFKTEIDEAAIYAYIYAQAQPKRHLEFGTWEGFGAALCASNCAAEIWTVNLPEGEKDKDGEPVYDRLQPSPEIATVATEATQPTDLGDFIGWRYRAAGFADRVHQILCDSRDLDVTAFGDGFFDSILIDGGHTADVVASDTNKALALLRSGGILIWHDFCPDQETLRCHEAPRGVVRAIVDNFNEWSGSFSKIFWIQPSWMLVGIKK